MDIERHGTIIAYSREVGYDGATVSFKITQEAKPCIDGITPTAAETPMEGGEVLLSVSASSPDCQWTASSNQSWAHLSQTSGTGDGLITITVDGHAHADSRQAKISVSGMELTITQAGDANNLPPTASAGADQLVAPGDTVVLDGSASRDADGSIVSYTWEQSSSGATVTLMGANTAQASFTAPEPAGGSETLRFVLTVTDDSGSTASNAVLVTVQSGGAPAQVDTRTGWWWDSSKAGTGFAIETQSEDRVYVAWFTYDAEGAPRWYTCLASLSGNEFEGQIEAWSNGWELNAGPYQFPQSSVAGNMHGWFNNNGTGLVLEYLINGGDVQSVNLTRFMDDQHGGERSESDLAGWYVDQAYLGMGLFIETQNGQMFSALFHYGKDASPRWYTYAGAYSGAGASTNVEYWSNGQVAGSLEYRSPANVIVGTAAFANGKGQMAFTQDGQPYSMVPFAIPSPQ